MFNEETEHYIAFYDIFVVSLCGVVELTIDLYAYHTMETHFLPHSSPHSCSLLLRLEPCLWQLFDYDERVQLQCDHGRMVDLQVQ